MNRVINNQVANLKETIQELKQTTTVFNETFDNHLERLIIVERDLRSAWKAIDELKRKGVA